MASPFVYQSTGGSSGSRLSTRNATYSSGQRWYVGSASGGVDAASPRGLDRIRPLATISQAYTNAAAGDTIVLMENHAESPTGTLIIAKAGLWIEGEGGATTRPRLTCAGAVVTLDITAAGVVVENLYFPQSTAVSVARVRIASVGCEIRGCAFDSGASDTAAAVRFVTGAGQCQVKDTTFTSTATALTAQASIGIEVGNAMNDLDLDTVTFDGGTYGWSDYAFKGTAAVTRLAAWDTKLLRSSRFFTAIASVYRVHVSSASMTSYLVLTA